ncbi:MAG: hypothetical protein LBG16_04850 [Elusimicrobiota bacterium]|jgi:hypothetical protein|nr:hypothetical protein [Elusimicrobiota bacterium]
MIRKILCNYEFTYHGIPYKGYGLYLGDTSNHKTVQYKDFSSQVACLVLKHTEEELGRVCQCKYWDINRKRLETAGIMMKMIEVYFYPNP